MAKKIENQGDSRPSGPNDVDASEKSVKETFTPYGYKKNVGGGDANNPGPKVFETGSK